MNELVDGQETIFVGLSQNGLDVLELELVFALTVCHLLLRASLLQELCISRAMRR